MTAARIDHLFDLGYYAEAFAAIDQLALENPTLFTSETDDSKDQNHDQTS